MIFLHETEGTKSLACTETPRHKSFFCKKHDTDQAVVKFHVDVKFLEFDVKKIFKQFLDGNKQKKKNTYDSVCDKKIYKILYSYKMKTGGVFFSVYNCGIACAFKGNY